jgi:predicted SAM-dependent methyltransferase
MQHDDGALGANNGAPLASAAARAAKLLEPIPRTAKIIEVGASVNAIAPRSQGWNTKIVDVASRNELLEKYGHLPGADTIEEVDFVWRDGSLLDAVPREHHGSFDALIASHVIEHQPDVIGFLRAAETFLTATGIVVLAIPDKRFCFDYFKPLTLTGDVLAAYRARRTRHSSNSVWDHFAYNVAVNGVIAWGQHPIAASSLSLVSSFDHAYEQFLKCDEESSSPYIDVHAWGFTPANFELVLLELARLRLIDWRVDRLGPAIGCEFHAWLRRGGQDAVFALSEDRFTARRLELLKNTLLDAKEQIGFLAPAQESASADAAMCPRGREETGSTGAGEIMHEASTDYNFVSKMSPSDENPRDLFLRLVAEEKPTPVLEIGTLQDVPGTSTHHLDWFPYLRRRDFVMADIAPGADVDEVIDIHNTPFAWDGRFGAFLSESVFEHLKRPWIAAQQIYKVLRPGGLCYVCTVQTYPLHGFPSDYFRFSDEALLLIFEDAGFQVLSVGYEHRAKVLIPEYLFPLSLREGPTYDFNALCHVWNEGCPSYVTVHLVARRP